MTEKLKKAMEVILAEVESGNNYCWSHLSTCVMGKLIRELLGISHSEFVSRCMTDKVVIISWSFSLFCHELPTDILQVLDSNGLKTLDAQQLEFCSNPEVLAEMGEDASTVKDYEKYYSHVFVGRYLRIWLSRRVKQTSSSNQTDITVAALLCGR